MATNFYISILVTTSGLHEDKFAHVILYTQVNVSIPLSNGPFHLPALVRPFYERLGDIRILQVYFICL